METHKVLVHAILNLKDPVDEIFLFVLEVFSVRGVLDCAKDTEHACGSPAVA